MRVINNRDINISAFKVNEIFYSIQGEGFNTGIPMIFVRFSGCNLHCSFCDTDHLFSTLYKKDDLISRLISYTKSKNCNRILFTGGEPTLQIFTKIGVDLIYNLKKLGFKLYMETNGTICDGFEILHLFDWISLSPKIFPTPIQMYNEIKLVVHKETINLIDYFSLDSCPKYLQPNDNKNIEQVVGLVKNHPSWRLSLQIHKIIGID